MLATEPTDADGSGGGDEVPGCLRSSELDGARDDMAALRASLKGAAI